MKYIDVCSGISAPTAAWKPLGWKALCFAEVEKAPSAVLAHHYPDTPNHGDMTKYQEWPAYADVDVLVGGTPCQSFSVAGLRRGLADPRGNLMLTYLGIADRYRPRWLVWENVPGVLSSNGGRDFGTFLGALGELGYGFAYRVLDAQFFGVAQRRERVFVVGHLGDWRRAAEVLFERESLCWYPAPRRETGTAVAALTANGVGTCGADDNQGQAGHLIAAALDASFGRLQGCSGQDLNHGHSHLIAHTLRADGFDASEDGTGRGTRLVPVVAAPLTTDPYADRASEEANLIAFSCKDYGADAGDIAPTLRSMGHDKSHANAGGQGAVAFSENQRGELIESEVARALQTTVGKPGQGYVGIRSGWRVRRITPREAERLQGFPDDFTLVPRPKRNRHGNITRRPLMKDGPRYKMLGNSMAVPVVRKIGERIAMIDALQVEVSA